LSNDSTFSAGMEYQLLLPIAGRQFPFLHTHLHALR
jgi:hypothetical protein